MPKKPSRYEYGSARENSNLVHKLACCAKGVTVMVGNSDSFGIAELTGMKPARRENANVASLTLARMTE